MGSKVKGLNDPTTFFFNHLFNVEDAFFARREHPLQGREILLKDLSEFPELDVAPIVNRHFGISGAADDGVAAWRSNKPPTQLSSNSMTSGISMLQDSNAYLIYPITTRDYFKRHGIDMLNVSDRSRDQIEIGIYTLVEKQSTALQESFLDLIKTRSTFEPCLHSKRS